MNPQKQNLMTRENRMAKTDSKREMCRPGQAMELFGVSRATIYRWSKNGAIRIYKYGGSSFLDIAEVKHLIKSGIKPGARLGD